jgi:hypothetical protein
MIEVLYQAVSGPMILMVESTVFMAEAKAFRYVATSEAVEPSPP